MKPRNFITLLGDSATAAMALRVGLTTLVLTTASIARQECFTPSDGGPQGCYEVPDLPAPLYNPPSVSPSDPSIETLKRARARYEQLLRVTPIFMRQSGSWPTEWQTAPTDEASFTRRANEVREWLDRWGANLGDELHKQRFLQDLYERARSAIVRLEQELDPLRRQLNDIKGQTAAI